MSLRADEPHPEIQHVLEQLADQPPNRTLSVSGARRAHRDRIPESSGDEVGRIREFHIPGPDRELPVRVYEPDDDRTDRPAVTFFHGGGWVTGDLDTHDPLCRTLANELGAVVVAVHYRRAPEHPFPAPLEDAYAATRWTAANADVFDADRERLVVAGDSAGGNLAAAVSLMARDRGGPPVAHQLLVYPVTDHTLEYDSYDENADYPADRPGLAWCWDQYLETDLDRHHPYAAPMQVRSLADVAPATVVTAGFDGLRDEGIAYADRLESEGVPVTHHNYPDVTHGFMGMLVQPDLDRAREAIDDVARDIERSLE